MHGGVTGKASDGLPMSIQPRVRASREPWDMIVNGVKTLKGLGGWQTLLRNYRIESLIADELVAQ